MRRQDYVIHIISGACFVLVAAYITCCMYKRQEVISHRDGLGRGEIQTENRRVFKGMGSSFHYCFYYWLRRRLCRWERICRNCDAPPSYAIVPFFETPPRLFLLLPRQSCCYAPTTLMLYLATAAAYNGFVIHYSVTTQVPRSRSPSFLDSTPGPVSLI